jgi:hypothetical protein
MQNSARYGTVAYQLLKNYIFRNLIVEIAINILLLSVHHLHEKINRKIGANVKLLFISSQLSNITS